MSINAVELEQKILVTEDYVKEKNHAGTWTNNSTSTYSAVEYYGDAMLIL